ncbi:Zinc finger RING/FYVE/PHD-type protein [Lasiodiplodia theobromae]|uniref:Zinc finger RING/FYVE/PHD-type protein n=1 Tax=Lasiodiplodia theobromae TaxID=45133 RepID=UPI0015C3ACBC|nr:Zinc finger RING/FYVE/PHD-type protein [Lasiodiplodia theobromae]KAF4535115.1 Zinc finger RING/FYVE/PHD-type protein [Lasiodiplodia theobromae]
MSRSTIHGADRYTVTANFDYPNFDKPRIKRTTGILRSMLQTIEKALTTDGLTDDSRQPSGVMVNTVGEHRLPPHSKKSPLLTGGQECVTVTAQISMILQTFKDTDQPSHLVCLHLYPIAI